MPRNSPGRAVPTLRFGALKNSSRINTIGTSSR